VCQSHTGHMTGLWFLPTRPLRLNNNKWMRIPLIKLTVFLEESLIYWFGIFYSLFCRTFMDVSEMRLRYCVPPESDTSWKTMFFMISSLVDSVWNVMAHAQKPDFVFRWNGRVHLNRRGASVQSTTGSRGVRISGSNAGYTMFRGSVMSTGYPLHSPVSPSFPLLCVTVCHHISTGV
jgi:hypothetical protein